MLAESVMTPAEPAATSAARIPKLIHYCWFGPSPISELGQRCIETWREHMPDFSIQKWDEERLDRSNRYIDLAYRAGRFAFVADYVRFQTLYDHGGVYLDTDMEVLRSFEPLLTEALFLGLQAPQSVGVGVIGATKGHPFLRRVLDALDDEARRGRLSFAPVPDLVTQLLELGRRDESVAIFPETYFYPYNPYSPVPLRRKPLQVNLSPATFCIHHWEGTWLGEASLKMLLSIRVRGLLRKANPQRWLAASLMLSGGMGP